MGLIWVDVQVRMVIVIKLKAQYIVLMANVIWQSVDPGVLCIFLAYIQIFYSLFLVLMEKKLIDLKYLIILIVIHGVYDILQYVVLLNAIKNQEQYIVLMELVIKQLMIVGDV